MSAPIERFSGRYRFLSNFFLVRVSFEGDYYRSVEHAYQAAKTVDPSERSRVMSCERPGQAKRVGRELTLRKDWERTKDLFMLFLLRKKFCDEVMRERLLATGESALVEGNGWGDEYWGVCDGTCRNGPHPPRGSNRLGILLMQVRRELRDGA